MNSVRKKVDISDVETKSGQLNFYSCRAIFMSLNTVEYIWKLTNYINPEVQCHNLKVSPIIPILSRINPIPRIDPF